MSGKINFNPFKYTDKFYFIFKTIHRSNYSINLELFIFKKTNLELFSISIGYMY